MFWTRAPRLPFERTCTRVNIEARSRKADTSKLEEAASFIRDAMDKIEQEDEWYSLGGIGSLLRAAQPDFDPRSYGARKLSDLVKNLGVLGFETRKQGNHLQLRWVAADARKQG